MTSVCINKKKTDKTARNLITEFITPLEKGLTKQANKIDILQAMQHKYYESNVKSLFQQIFPGNISILTRAILPNV